MKILLHPSYFPSIATFVAIASAEEIIWEIEDNFSKQTYRNRCYIYGANGKLSINIPVIYTQKNRQKYKEVKIFNEDNWQSNHWKSLQSAYNTSPFFEYYQDEIKPLFQKDFTYLMDFNLTCFEVISDCMQLQVQTSHTKCFQKTFDNTADFRFLINAKKEIIQNFEPYFQVFSDKHGFIPNMSILDLLFNEGPNAIKYLKEQEVIKSL